LPPPAAEADRPIALSSLLGAACAETREAIGKGLLQLHGLATDETWLVVPKTLTLLGSVASTKALPSTVKV
jgi:hypothetical protein